MSAPFSRYDNYWNTDKVHPHGFFASYLKIAADLKDDARVLEVGVATGDSLKMWQGLFPRGQIAGIDSNPQATWPEGTKKICSFQDNDVLPGLIGGTYDLIVDDASHDGELTRRTFNILWPCLNPGGYYVVEDWYVALGDGDVWGKQKHWGPGMLRTAESFLPMLFPKDGDVDEITYRYGLIIIHRRRECHS